MSYYIFTFGQDQENEGKCVRIEGDEYSTRKKMFEKYGNKWAFQYSEEEWEAIRNNPQRFWDMEEEIEF